MDYEKKYKEALEKARQLCAYPTTKPFISDLQDIFPELKESEDERIRGQLIRFFKSCGNLEWYDGLTPSKAVVWLEKQKSFAEREAEKDYNDWLEKQGEQKLVECKEKKYSKCYVYNLFHSEAFCKECEFNHNKQKPVEWGEEDEKQIRQIERIVKDAGCTTKLQEKIHNWLKSLKYRVQPQPKQEWSEEDEKKIKDIIYLLKQLKQHDKKDVYPQELINFLKSLRPQKQEQWNEQDIEMIDWLIRCCEKEYEELCNDRYGHQDIVSDLKRDCRKKWDWLESLKSKVVPQKQWKPSEGQLECLGYAIEKAEKDWSPLITNRIYLTLKALKEQLEKL